MNFFGNEKCRYQNIFTQLKFHFKFPLHQARCLNGLCIRTYPGVLYLLASWTDPKEGDEACVMMDKGLQYLQRIHDAVRKVSAMKQVEEPMEFCKRMVIELGLPEVAVNPLIARSFMSHMGILDRQDLKVLLSSQKELSYYK